LYQWVIDTGRIAYRALVLHVASVGFGQFRGIDGDQVVLIDGPGLKVEHCRSPLAVVPGRVGQVARQTLDGTPELVGIPDP